jgi:hypothetical protein
MLGMRLGVLSAGLGLITGLAVPSVAHADNRRLNDGVVANIYTIQRRAGCDGPTERQHRDQDQSGSCDWPPSGTPTTC